MKSNEQKQSEAIKRMVDNKREKIKKLLSEIKELQERCPHFGLIEIHGSDTGNWCPADDEYWTDYKCLYCGKSWRVYAD